MGTANISQNTISAEPLSASKKVRYEWLDVLRAFAIIFVILGHQAANGIYSIASVTSHVKLAIFFAVSGFLFSKSKIDAPAAFFKNKIFRLLLPYVYLSSVSVIVPGIVKSIKGTSVFSQIIIGLVKQLLHGDILWFIPNLFLAEILMFAVLKISKKSNAVIAVLSVVFLIVGAFTKDTRRYLAVQS